MKVILLESIRGVGEAGAVVEVAAGYARNLLLPRGLAQEASPANLERRQVSHTQEAQRARRARQQADAAAQRLSGAVVRIAARVGRSGRLFGSVTAGDIASAVERHLGVQLDRRRIDLEEPIKVLGAHPVRAQLHPEIQVAFTVDVVAEEGGGPPA